MIDSSEVNEKTDGSFRDFTLGFWESCQKPTDASGDVNGVLMSPDGRDIYNVSDDSDSAQQSLNIPPVAVIQESLNIRLSNIMGESPGTWQCMLCRENRKNCEFSDWNQSCMSCVSRKINCVEAPIPQQQRKQTPIINSLSQSTIPQSSQKISDLVKMNDSTPTSQQVVQHVISPFSILQSQQSQMQSQYKAQSHQTKTYINQFYPSRFYNSDILVPTEGQITVRRADYSVWNVVVERNKFTHSYRKLIIKCLYDSVDDDCRYCLEHGKSCGEKMSKNQYLNKDDRVHPEMFSIQSSVFIEFWIKITKLHYPAANEEDILDVLKKSIEQREGKKRARSTVDNEDDDSTSDKPMKDKDVHINLTETDSMQHTELLKSKEVHSIDLEADHSLDQGLEEDEDEYWITRYMLLEKTR